MLFAIIKMQVAHNTTVASGVTNLGAGSCNFRQQNQY